MFPIPHMLLNSLPKLRGQKKDYIHKVTTYVNKIKELRTLILEMEMGRVC